MTNIISARAKWRDSLYRIYFEADTPAGKLFDILLVIAIVLSVLAVIIDSVSSIHKKWSDLLFYFEWLITIISIASSSAITKIVAGVILTYTRAFRLNDRIKVGATTGAVVEKHCWCPAL